MKSGIFVNWLSLLNTNLDPVTLFQVMNMIILGVLQIATIYSTTFSQFLAVRSIFGLFMGGVYGNAIAMVKSSPSTSPFYPTYSPQTYPPPKPLSQLYLTFYFFFPGPRKLPRRRARSHVRNSPTRLLLRLRVCSVRQLGRRRIDGVVEDGILDCGGIEYWSGIDSSRVSGESTVSGEEGRGS